MSNEHQCFQLTCAEFWRVTDGDRIRTCRPFSSSPTAHIGVPTGVSCTVLLFGERRDELDSLKNHFRLVILR